jgi:hypothetical protein
MASTAPGVRFLVVGSPRSGTTLVQRLACEIPGVRMPPETHFFTRFAVGLMARRHFPLDTAALADEIRLFAASDYASGLEIDVETVVTDLGGTCAGPFELFAALVRHLAGPAEIWGEKTPNHLVWWRPISRASPQTSFVAVVRDPRAVVSSNLDMPWRDDTTLPGWGGHTAPGASPPCGRSSSARWWRMDRASLGPERCLTSALRGRGGRSRRPPGMRLAALPGPAVRPPAPQTVTDRHRAALGDVESRCPGRHLP